MSCPVQLYSDAVLAILQRALVRSRPLLRIKAIKLSSGLIQIEIDVSSRPRGSN